ncbi:MAG TPA: thiosulfohydrolase SoxB [Burkholderiales bacterium]|nr:thiosulfohydrolase SoxB [Burkholderiales bacterium]
MFLTRREFLQILAAAASCGLPLAGKPRAAVESAVEIYDLPPSRSAVTLLHFTDCHGQLLPTYYREPDANIGMNEAWGKPPHLVGEALLRHFGIASGSRLAHAYTCLDFEDAARRFGKVGGFAHLTTLVKQIRAQRPGALLLDGGDSWQGSATALWTRGSDMIAASRLLGVDAMTGHWEFTYGAQRVRQAIAGELSGKIEFIAQNVKTADFGDPVFKPYVIREVNKIPVAIIGQAFPYTPIAHPRHLVAEWTFGIQEEHLQQIVEETATKGAQVIVLLSHNGADVDLKLASRVRGIHAILGGHTHDAVPIPVLVKNAGGTTIVTNAGSNGKFLGVLDIEVRGGAVRDFQYRLMPVFASLLEPDQEMASLIRKVREPYEDRLAEKLAVTEDLLYRRGNFTGTFDQIILDALMEVREAEIAFSPGFRWGTTVPSRETITMEHVMNQTAITYPHVTVNELTGTAIKAILEDVCDNLFNPDPYYQLGGDMVRVGGMQYACDPAQRIGRRIDRMMLKGKPIEAGRKYKVVSWAPVAEGAGGEPAWEIVAQHLRARRVVRPMKPSRPTLTGVHDNPGVSKVPSQ